MRSASVWGGAFALVVTTSVTGYRSLYRTAAARGRLAAQFSSDPAIAALVGPARGIDTVEGFTVWRGVVILNVLGAVWGVLQATRRLRGEEEAGHAELVLAGATTPRRSCAAGLTGLAAGLGLLWAIPTATATVLGAGGVLRAPPGAAAFLGVTLCADAAVFLALGALASQLAPTRRQAAAISGGVVGAAYLLRMIADSGAGLAWLGWASPLGWAERLRPLTGSDLVPLLPLVATTAVLAGTTLLLAGRRDLGAATLPDRAEAQPRLRLLGGVWGLALRLGRGTVLAWWAGLAGFGTMIGLVATSAGRVLSTSPGTRRVIARLTGHAGGAAAYLGAAFLIAAALVGLVAAGAAVAAREEEASGRLDAILAGPTGRVRWLLSRLAVGLAGVGGAGAVAALAAWCGVSTQGGGVGLRSLLAAGGDAAAAALVILGLGVLALGVWPRGVAAVTYGALAWSFLVEMVGSVAGLDHWVLDTSVFHHLRAAPAVPAGWVGAAALAALGLALGAVGTVCFARRDLTGA